MPFAPPIDDHAAPALIALARAAVRAEVTNGALSLPPPAATPTAAVFVTIERSGTVIGCRGSLAPLRRTLEEEVVSDARSAAGHDPRYRPLTAADLAGMLVTVTVVERLEPLDVTALDTLPPDNGLVLTASGRTGVVLPWEGKDPRTRLRWAYKKAGVAAGSPCVLRRMVAKRFRG